MAKPRVFVSSTYYDLRHIRQGLDAFINEIGYEPILFENGDIPFTHDKPLDESCYREIMTCHVLVLIIGGRFGSPVSTSTKQTDDDELEHQYKHYNSITQKEYETAIEADIPVYVFVEKGVHAEYETFKKNRNTQVAYAHVDNPNIFLLLDGIYSQRRNNLTREFDKLSDITSWLRDQWAGLFAEFLSGRTAVKQLTTMTMQLARLENVAEALKDYSESMIRDMAPSKAESIIKDTEIKLKQKSRLDIFARHHLIRHLTEDHDVSADDLYEAFRVATSISDVVGRVQKLLAGKEQSCGMIDAEIFPGDFDSLRKIMDLPPLIGGKQKTGLKGGSLVRSHRKG